MRFEHVALNVPAPAAAARWYADHLGAVIHTAMTEPPFTHFLRDSSGRVVLETYANPSAPTPDYARQDPLVLHLAFVSDDVDADQARLLEAGATSVARVELPDGTQLAMLRDPWGLAIQLCRRAQRFP